MLRKGVVQHDSRLLTRVLRQLSGVRSSLTPAVVTALTKQYAPEMTAAITEEMGAEMSDADATEEDLSPPASVSSVPPPAPAAAPAASASHLPDGGAAAAASAAAARRHAELVENHRKEQELLSAVVPEVDIYVQLLCAYFLFDRGLKAAAATRITALFQSLANFNRRSLDALSAKIITFYAFVHEATGKDVEIRK